MSAVFLLLSLLFQFLYIQLASAVVLKTAAQDSSPKYIISSTVSGPKVTGYCIDILRALENENLDLKFVGDQTPLPFSRMQIYLSKGEIDVFCGIQKNDDRVKIFDFIEVPLIRLRGKLATHHSNLSAPSSWSDLIKLKNEKRIITIKNTASAGYAKKNLGVVDDSPSSLDQALYMLVNKRADYVFYHDLGLMDSIERLKIESKVKILPNSFYSEEQYFAVSKKLPRAVVKRIEDGLLNLKRTGRLNKILSGYSAVKRENLDDGQP